MGRFQGYRNMTYLRCDSLKQNLTKISRNNPETQEKAVFSAGHWPWLPASCKPSQQRDVAVRNPLIPSPAFSRSCEPEDGTEFLPQCLAEQRTHRKHSAGVCWAGRPLTNIANPNARRVLPRSGHGCLNKCQHGASLDFANPILSRETFPHFVTE